MGSADTGLLGYDLYRQTVIDVICNVLECASDDGILVPQGGRRLETLATLVGITEDGQKRIDSFKEEWKEILAIYRFVTKEDEKDE